MLRNKTFLIPIFILLFPFITTSTAKGENVEDYSFGLAFLSHEVNKDERTSLDLTPSKSLPLSRGFTMEFDLKIRSAAHSYGYIFGS